MDRGAQWATIHGVRVRHDRANKPGWTQSITQMELGLPIPASLCGLKFKINTSWTPGVSRIKEFREGVLKHKRGIALPTREQD